MIASPSPLISQALERALTAPDGLPLLASKSAPGLFPSVAAGKAAAQEARDTGLVRVLRTESKGKTTTEYCTLTETGLTLLLEHSSPRPILEAILKAIENCQTRIDAWAAGVAEQRNALLGLRELAARVLTQMQKPDVALPPWARNGHAHHPQARIVELLTSWHAAGQIGDCPLPDLFEQMKATSPKLTLGEFHDALRALHEQGKLYLHPWTGPLHELPKPAASLLVGHEIAYYASSRS